MLESYLNPFKPDDISMQLPRLAHGFVDKARQNEKIYTTPLSWALVVMSENGINYQGRSNICIFDLLHLGVDVNQPFCCRFTDTQEEEGKYWNKRNGQSMLQFAFEMGNDSLMDKFLARGARFCRLDRGPLVMGMQISMFTLIKTINLHADGLFRPEDLKVLRSSDEEGNNAFHAMVIKNPEMVFDQKRIDFLLRVLNLNPEATNLKGESPMDLLRSETHRSAFLQNAILPWKEGLMMIMTAHMALKDLPMLAQESIFSQAKNSHEVMMVSNMSSAAAVRDRVKSLHLTPQL